MVQRYRPDSDEEGRSFEMIPDDGGDYVAYEDYEELEAEVGRLQMMNPCNHTGYEAAPCDVCGYPDPRKLIVKLKEENQRLREALDRIESMATIENTEIQKIAREALKEDSHEG
jgi:hypothetical protein